VARGITTMGQAMAAHGARSNAAHKTRAATAAGVTARQYEPRLFDRRVVVQCHAPELVPDAGDQDADARDRGAGRDIGRNRVRGGTLTAFSRRRRSTRAERLDGRLRRPSGRVGAISRSFSPAAASFRRYFWTALISSSRVAVGRPGDGCGRKTVCPRRLPSNERRS
jgi:hypothetical protein